MARLNPGSARREDGAQTRERLLDAAEELFAERGFNATLIRDIVDQAGCNIAAVNYHFQGKENLYYEVLKRCLAALRELRLARIRSTMDGTDAGPELETILAAYAQAFVEPVAGRSSSRRLMQLYSRELLEPHVSPDLLLTELVEPVQQSLAQAIDAVCPGLDADDLRTCIQLFVAQLVYLLHMESYFGPARSAQLALPSCDETVEMIVRFSAAGIRSLRRLQHPASDPSREEEA